MEVDAAKKALRREIRSKVGLIPREMRKVQSEAACRRISALDAFCKARLIVAYMPLSLECDPSHAVRVALSNGKRVAYPLCEDEGKLSLHVPIAPDAFAVGRYGILEPIQERCVRVAFDEADLIIVPGIAFDGQCRRLGRGGGFYDRLLESAKAVRVGLAFDEQIVSAVPTCAHDAAMDYVVSANGIIVK